jgi:hypothetical protein
MKNSLNKKKGQAAQLGWPWGPTNLQPSEPRSPLSLSIFLFLLFFPADRWDPPIRFIPYLRLGVRPEHGNLLRRPIGDSSATLTPTPRHRPPIKSPVTPLLLRFFPLSKTPPGPCYFSLESAPKLAASWRSPSACGRPRGPRRGPEVKHATSPRRSACHPPMRQPREPLERHRRPHRSRSLAGDDETLTPHGEIPLSLFRPSDLDPKDQISSLNERVPVNLMRPTPLRSNGLGSWSNRSGTVLSQSATWPAQVQNRFKTGIRIRFEPNLWKFITFDL